MFTAEYVIVYQPRPIPQTGHAVMFLCNNTVGGYHTNTGKQEMVCGMYIPFVIVIDWDITHTMSYYHNYQCMYVFCSCG
jgi:hypothetical protein